MLWPMECECKLHDHFLPEAFKCLRAVLYNFLFLPWWLIVVVYHDNEHAIMSPPKEDTALEGNLNQHHNRYEFLKHLNLEIISFHDIT